MFWDSIQISNLTVVIFFNHSRWPQKRLAAGHGQNSTRLKILGEKGNDLKLDVPVGIKVIREDGKLIGI